MPRYEYIEGGEHGSQKFWEISIEGSSLVRRWGRIGTKGQTKKVDFADPREAQREYETLIAEKRAKGYELVEGTGIERAPDVAPPKSARNPSLEAKIEENPADEQAWLVYGDWLQSQGDPRGELIALQAAMRRPGITPSEFLPFKKREAEILHDHKAHFQGGLENEPYCFSAEWRWGFVYKVTLQGPVVDVGNRKGWREKFLRLLDHPSGSLFQELDIQGGDNSEAVIEDLARTGRPRTLRRLALRHGVVKDLRPLARAFPRLERLTLSGTTELVEGSAPSFPNVKVLRVEGTASPELLQSKWPMLESLTLWNTGIATKTLLAPLLERDTCPMLASLDVANARDGDGFLAILACSPLLAHLKRLDIRGGVTEAGAHAIVAAKDRFAHLEKLGLHLAVPRDVYGPLKKVCKDVDVSLDIDLGGEPKTGKRGEEPRRRYESIRE